MQTKHTKNDRQLAEAKRLAEWDAHGGQAPPIPTLDHEVFEFLTGRKAP